MESVNMAYDIEQIRQSPRQFVDLETVEWLSDRVMILEQRLAAKDALLRELRVSVEWIGHQSENQRVWGRQGWQYPFPHKLILYRAMEAMEAIDKELK